MKILKIFLIAIIFPVFVNGQVEKDVFEIKFIAGITQYRAAMILNNDGTGKMRVRYYDNGTKMVEQSIIVENSNLGYRWRGYNPVHPGTNKPYLNYSPDILYYSIDEYGNHNATIIDAYDTVAQAQVTLIEGDYQRKVFLAGFDWKLPKSVTKSR